MSTNSTTYTEDAMPHGSSLADTPGRNTKGSRPADCPAARVVDAIPRTDTGWTFTAT